MESSKEQHWVVEPSSVYSNRNDCFVVSCSTKEQNGVGQHELKQCGAQGAMVQHTEDRTDMQWKRMLT